MRKVFVVAVVVLLIGIALNGKEVVSQGCSGGLPTTKVEVCAEQSNADTQSTEINCFSADSKQDCISRLQKLAAKDAVARGTKCSPGCVGVPNYSPGSNPRSGNNGKGWPATSGNTLCVWVKLGCNCVEKGGEPTGTFSDACAGLSA